MFGVKIWFLRKTDQFWANLPHVWYFSFSQITSKKLSLCSWEITKKTLRRKGLTIFHFSTLWIWKFWIFDKRLQGCDEVKNSIGLLQGPRLMAWTKKSPIQGNHWVPLGYRALLGSVNLRKFFTLAQIFKRRYQIMTLSTIHIKKRCSWSWFGTFFEIWAKVKTFWD